jgi:glycosyltransferase involved in cell wall biosynthesis
LSSPAPLKQRTANLDRVGFDARLIGGLGIGRYIRGLLPPLSESLDGRLTILATPQDRAPVRAEVGPAPEIVVAGAAPYRLQEQTALLAQLTRHQLPLVHFPHYNLPVAYRGRFVVTIHDLFSFQYPEIHSGGLPRFVNQVLIKNAVRRAAAVITPSNATAAELLSRFPAAEGRIHPIAEAADPRFGPERDRRAELTWQDLFRIRPPYLLSLGQWKAYKNLPLLIEAFGQVHKQYPQAQLVIAGQDPRHPEVPAAARTLPEGSVVFPGRLPDDAIADLYRGAAAVVLPSRAEGFGLPVIEAMACGTRVVCSDLPVLREVAADVPIYCDPADPSSFAQGMLTALTPPAGDRRPELGIARARLFSWRRAADETIEVYERALAR